MLSSRRKGLRLRSRLLASFLVLVAAVIALVILVVDFRQRAVMLQLNQERGLAVAHSLAAGSSSSLLSYNYVALQQLAQRAAEKERMRYVIVLDKEGRVAGYSDHPERQGRQLDDPEELKVSEPHEEIVRRVTWPEMGGEPGLDISVPVFVEGSPRPWGLVRVGVSLDAMYAEIQRTRLLVLGMGVVVLLLSLLAVRLLAKRITDPLNRLVEATRELARGNFEFQAGITTGDEIEDLSRKFDGMAREIRLRQTEVHRSNEKLAELNSNLEKEVGERTRALLEAEEKYRLLVEQSPNPICIVQDGDLVFFNRSFVDTFGYDKDELSVGNFRFERLIDPEHREKLEALQPEALSAGGAWGASAEILARHKNGDAVYLDVRSTVISYLGHPALEAILVDVTEQRKIRDQIVAAERLRALGEMASGVAHDFNNVLGAILARAQFLLPKAKEPEVERGLRIIAKAAQDGAEAVKRIQDFSRVRTDRDFGPVDLNSVLEDVLEMTRPQWMDEAHRSGKRISVLRSLGEIPPVLGNLSELREAFMNLLLNAVQAIRSDGTIEVSTSSADKRVQVLLSDTGEGMSPEVQRRLFDPFFTTKGPGGNGLGMSIVYGIVQRHGGTIEVESKLHEGTTFLISLVAAESGVATDAEPHVSDWGKIEEGTGMVLVVDDEVEIRQLVADILEAAGYVVRMAGDGAEAIKMLEGVPFDLIVTDLGMPGVSGWEVAERSRQVLPETPVLLLTGWGAALSSEEVEKRGIARALQKPFDMQELLATVHTLLDAGTFKKSA